VVAPVLILPVLGASLSLKFLLSFVFALTFQFRLSSCVGRFDDAYDPLPVRLQPLP